MGTSCRKCAQKASPRLLFNFAVWHETAIAYKKIF